MRKVIGSTLTLVVFLVSITAALLIGSGPSSARAASQPNPAMAPRSVLAAAPESTGQVATPSGFGQQIEVQIGGTASESPSGTVSSSGGVDALTTTPAPSGGGGGGLAFTGVAVLGACVLALVLLVTGSVMARLGRRNRASH